MAEDPIDGGARAEAWRTWIARGATLAFCVLADGHEPNGDLRAELVAWLVEALGKPLKPREVLFATALPKTRNAKVMRRLIRSAYLGLDLGDVSSLEHPDTLDAVRAAV